jgi:hypothetical protein
METRVNFFERGAIPGLYYWAKVQLPFLCLIVGWYGLLRFSIGATLHTTGHNRIVLTINLMPVTITLTVRYWPRKSMVPVNTL